MTAAGIMVSIVASQSNPMMAVLVALAIGSGSLVASHVNDAGFWIFQEFFDISIKQTFQIWTVLETVISITGLLVIIAMTMLLI